jgi:uncharacterized repeat protein (TIGR03803 family)
MIYSAFEALILALFASAAATPTFRIIYNSGADGLNEVLPQFFFASAGGQQVFTITSRGAVTVVATPPSGYFIEGPPVLAANGRAYSFVTAMQRSSLEVYSVTRHPSSLRTYPAQSFAPGFALGLPDGKILARAGVPSSGSSYLAEGELDGTITPIYQFPSGEVLVSVPIYGSNGNYYGVSWAPNPDGASYVFQVTPAGVLTKLASLPNASFDSGDFGSLIQAAGGVFYGTTALGGANNYGTAYQVTPAGQYTLLYSFVKGHSAYPSMMILGSDGNFYGTTSGLQHGLPYSEGEIFRLTMSGQYTTLHTFKFSDGACSCWLMQASDGILYGIAVGGGSTGGGTIWAYDAGLPKPAPQALSFHPAKGSVGTKVRIWGYNLLAASVQFNGVAATDPDNAGPNYVYGPGWGYQWPHYRDDARWHQHHSGEFPGAVTCRVGA